MIHVTANPKLKGHLAALLSILIWGTTFISSKVLLRDFLPAELLFFRIGLAVLALTAAHPRRMPRCTARQHLHYAAAGLCGVTLYFLLENIALTYTLASNVGVIISVAPIFTAVLAHLFLAGERLRGGFFVGFFAAIAGIVLISFNGNFILKLNPLGDILAVLAALSWGVYSILVRKIGAFGNPTIESTRRIFCWGLLFLLPALPFTGFRLDLGRFAEPVYLLNILYLAFGASALCFVSWNFAVGQLGAVSTSVYIYMVPVVTIITSVLILHEPITWMAALGAALTLGGLLLSERLRTAFPVAKEADAAPQPGPGGPE